MNTIIQKAINTAPAQLMDITMGIILTIILITTILYLNKHHKL